MFTNMDHMMMSRSSNFISSKSVNENKNNWVGASDVFHDNFEWTSQRQSRPTLGQYHPQNEWAMDNESKSSSADGSSTQSLTSPQVPPRPQRPFTEYNVSDVYVHLLLTLTMISLYTQPTDTITCAYYITSSPQVFFQLERELLLQDGSDDMKKCEAAQKILSSGKEIESSDVAALRPPQYRHLALSVDWFVVGNKYKSSSTKSSSDSSTFAPSKRRASAKKKESHGKISFLELTKLISNKWRKVCQNDPVTKEFCKKIAAGEAARYKKGKFYLLSTLRVFRGSINLKLGVSILYYAELEEYKLRYGEEAAKGKKRKTRKSLSSETQKKSKQGNEEEEIDMLSNFVPIEGDLEEDDLVSPQSYTNRQQVPFTVSDLGGSSHMQFLYARQQEIQARLMQYRQRRIASPPLSSSFTMNTFQGIPKDFSQSQTFQGAIITPNAPYANRYAQLRQKLQDGYDRLQRLNNDTTCAMRRNAGQSFVRQNSAFDSKYDFLDSADGDMDDDDKVGEFLRDYEHKVFRQVSTSYSDEDASSSGFFRMGGGIDRNLYLKKFHRKCLDKKSRYSQSEVSGGFHLVNNHSSEMNFTSNATSLSAPKLKKLRSLQSNDWALFTEHVEIKDDDDDDITTTFM